jgi:hypothetical protein
VPSRTLITATVASRPRPGPRRPRRRRLRRPHRRRRPRCRRRTDRRRRGHPGRRERGHPGRRGRGHAGRRERGHPGRRERGHPGRRRRHCPDRRLHCPDPGRRRRCRHCRGRHRRGPPSPHRPGQPARPRQPATLAHSRPNTTEPRLQATRRRPVLRLPGQATRDQLPQLARQGADVRRAVDQPVHQRGARPRTERSLPTARKNQHRTQAEDVARRPGVLAQDLLRRQEPG